MSAWIEVFENEPVPGYYRASLHAPCIVAPWGQLNVAAQTALAAARWALTHHQRECGCDATHDLEARYLVARAAAAQEGRGC